ncbi:ubiquinol oxidase subunit II [Methylobacterium organophilum]|uniref:Ubiquinol oxidase polypeptide II n=1 Tax=Methylobacterium organophilum TaxID=410 RepID=A0ABQ4TG42_METOR|nr:ubiquinol oxidase subunit II [Methylobacterium organophilum]UMY17339.1 ubiquinol oxidase subunit II [Methylobacterium organophilum]GJE29274.1 Cytochrome bo(3) ubiquinol oxidase subunit 2 [Methylobacterium organophilum]
MTLRTLRTLALLPLFGLLSGCNMVLMQPSGDIAARQRDLLIASTGLMLLIIVPVIAFTLFFAWRYRSSNTEAAYDPDWHHSTQLEVLIWSAPLVIIIALGALTWISTHTLDPYRPLSRIEAGKPVPAGVKPLTVEVVALDWKWLFFYPDQGIATVNELAAPVDVPITFKITSASIMNSFFIPALAGQVYAMAGMETKLHAVINKAGVYEGFSANYSGSGFSRMNFKFHGLDKAGFDAWVAKVKSDGSELSRDAYLKLERPSEQEPVRYYKSVDEGLYSAVLNMCAVPGKMCMNEMMHIDMAGGAGKESHENRERLEYDNRHAIEGHEAEAATVPASGRPARAHDVQPEGMKPDHVAPKSNEGGAPPAEPRHDHSAPGTTHDDPAPNQTNQ